jgi:hypothetical protein
VVSDLVSPRTTMGEVKIGKEEFWQIRQRSSGLSILFYYYFQLIWRTLDHWWIFIIILLFYSTLYVSFHSIFYVKK